MFHTTFYLRRLHSLVGLFVLGGVVFEHIFTNSMAMGGAAALNGALALMEMIPKPIFYGIEICAIALGFARNWQFALQRWTAWYLVFFLIWHIGYLRIFTKGITGTPISYELLHTLFTTSPITTVLYIIGMFAAIFHFANGITTFCMTWGIAKGPRVQKVINCLSLCLCAVLCLITLAFMGSYFVM